MTKASNRPAYSFVGKPELGITESPTAAPSPFRDSKVVAMTPSFAKQAGIGKRINERARVLVAMLGPDGRDVLCAADVTALHKLATDKHKDEASAWTHFVGIERGLLALCASRIPKVIVRDGVVRPMMRPDAKQPKALTAALAKKANVKSVA